MKRFQCAMLVIALPLFFLCCSDEYTFKSLPEGPIKHQLIVAAKIQNGVRAQGFPGATPPLMPVYFEIGESHQQVKAGADGSFLIELTPLEEAKAGQFLFDGKIKQIYKIRDLDNSLNLLAKKAFALSMQNQELAVDDIAVLSGQALLLSSTASLICPLSLDARWVLKTDNAKSILLNPEAKQSLMPRSIASNADFALVTLQGSHELALVDLKHGQISEKSRLKDKAEKPYQFSIKPPLKLASGLIDNSLADSPEKIVHLGNNLFVASFANYYQFANPASGQDAVLGPGLIALLSIEGSAIKTRDILQLPYKNPLFIVKKNNDQIFVVCAGIYENINDAKLRSKDAGLIRFKLSTDNNKLEEINRIPLKDFVPAEPAWHGDTLVVPEAFGAKVALLKENATELLATNVFSKNSEWKFLFAAHWYNDIFFLADSLGFLIGYSLSSGFYPFPFIKPIPLNKSQASTIPFFPQKILFRHQESGPALNDSYPPGYSAWVISQLQSKVVPLDFLEIFGP